MITDDISANHKNIIQEGCERNGSNLRYPYCKGQKELRRCSGKNQGTGQGSPD